MIRINLYGDSLIGETKMSSKSIESLIDYLTKDNRKNIRAFVDGEIDVQFILRETGVKREDFYRSIDSNIIKNRKDNVMLQRKIISENIFNMIKENIPYEYMDIDEVKLFGKSSKYLKEQKVSVKKSRITNILREHGIIISESEFKFMNYNLIETMYRKIMVIDSYKLGYSGYKLAKMFNTYPSIVYKILDDYDETGRYINNISLFQESVFIRNVELFKKYKNDSSIVELSVQYNIQEEYLEKIINVLIDVEKNQINKGRKLK